MSIKSKATPTGSIQVPPKSNQPSIQEPNNNLAQQQSQIVQSSSQLPAKNASQVQQPVPKSHESSLELSQSFLQSIVPGTSAVGTNVPKQVIPPTNEAKPTAPTTKIAAPQPQITPQAPAENKTASTKQQPSESTFPAGGTQHSKQGSTISQKEITSSQQKGNENPDNNKSEQQQKQQQQLNSSHANLNIHSLAQSKFEPSEFEANQLQEQHTKNERSLSEQKQQPPMLVPPLPLMNFQSNTHTNSQQSQPENENEFIDFNMRKSQFQPLKQGVADALGLRGEQSHTESSILREENAQLKAILAERDAEIVKLKSEIEAMRRMNPSNQPLSNRKLNVDHSSNNQSQERNPFILNAKQSLRPEYESFWDAPDFFAAPSSQTSSSQTQIGQKIGHYQNAGGYNSTPSQRDDNLFGAKLSLHQIIEPDSLWINATDKKASQVIRQSPSKTNERIMPSEFTPSLRRKELGGFISNMKGVAAGTGAVASKGPFEMAKSNSPKAYYYNEWNQQQNQQKMHQNRNSNNNLRISALEQSKKQYFQQLQQPNQFDLLSNRSQLSLNNNSNITNTVNINNHSLIKGKVSGNSNSMNRLIPAQSSQVVRTVKLAPMQDYKRNLNNVY